MYKIHSASVHNLDDKILKRLAMLTHGYRGNMLPVFNCLVHNTNSFDRNFYDGEAHYVTVNDTIVGWCLTFHVIYNDLHQHIAHLYVAEPYRNKGIGQAIANHVINMYPSIAAHKQYTNCFNNFNSADEDYLLYP